MLDRLEWQTLEHRRSCARLTLLYKIVHHLVAVPLPQYLEQPVRLYRRSHPYGFRQLSTTKDYYKGITTEMLKSFWTCQSFGLVLKILSVRTIKYEQKRQVFVSPNEILSVKSFGLTLFDITVKLILVIKFLFPKTVIILSINHDLLKKNNWAEKYNWNRLFKI